MNDPPVPPECNLQDFPFMPLDVSRLRDSGIAVEATGDEFRAAVMLWAASWHQTPAASLPNDDKALCWLAGYGRDLSGWQSVKAGALRGFEECTDGRLYHSVVAEKALAAWKAKSDQRKRTQAARAAYLAKHRTSNTATTKAVTRSVTESKGEGQGEREGHNPPIVPHGDGTVKKSRGQKQRARVQENTPLMVRIGAWFKRRPTSLWSQEEARALADLGEIPEEDLQLMAVWYGFPHKKGEDYRCRNPITLFNKWNGQLDLARRFIVEQRIRNPNFAPGVQL